MKKFLIVTLCITVMFSFSGCKLFMTEEELDPNPKTPEPVGEVEQLDDFLLGYIKNNPIDNDTYIVVSSDARGYGTGVVSLSEKKELIKPEYDSINYGYDENGELKFLAKSGSNYYLFGKRGNLIKDIGKYNEARITDNDMSRINVVTTDGIACVLDSNGEVMFSGDGYVYIKYDELSKNYIVGKNGKYGVASQSGELLVPLNYTVILPGAASGEYIARKNGGYGIVDSHNNVLTPFHYLKLTPIESGNEADKTHYYSARRIDKKKIIITSNDDIVQDAD